MSPRSSSNPGPFRKPRPDVYTVLLIISLLAILLSVLFLRGEVQDMPPEGGPMVSLEVPRPADAELAGTPMLRSTYHSGVMDRFISPVSV